MLADFAVYLNDEKRKDPAKQPPPLWQDLWPSPEDLKKAASEARFLQRSRKAGESWYRNASVRKSELQPFTDKGTPLDQSAADQYFSLEAIHPILVDLLRNSQPRAVAHFEILQLYRHLRFTSFLEHEVILPSFQDVAFEKLRVKIPRDLSIQALKLVTDEAFHGQRSEELILSLEERTGIPCNFSYSSRILESLLDLSDNSVNAKLRRFCFAFISETTISSTIALNSRSTKDPEIRAFFHEHFTDENIHSVYFQAAFAHVWKHLEAAQARSLAPIFETFFIAFTGNDWNAVLEDMKHSGLLAEARDLEKLLGNNPRLYRHLKLEHASIPLQVLREVDRQKIIFSRPFYSSLSI